MSRVHIVTDSCARFINSHFVAHHPITVVPNQIIIGGRVYREDVDISAEEALQLIARQTTVPVVKSPTIAEYVDIYKRLAHTHDAIISIHASREIYPSWAHARTAAQQLMGQCEIIVIDSQTLCAAQGILVQVAARALDQHEPVEEIVRRVRGAIDRIYSLYYVESIDFLRHNQIMSWSHTTLGTMLGIKPFLTIEDGMLI